MPELQFFDTQECTWSDVSVTVGGATVTKLKSVKYKSSKKKELIYGQGDYPIGIQGGNRAFEGEIKVLKGAVDDMNRAAIAAGGVDILDMEFDVVVVYAGKGTRALQTDTLVRCQVKEFEKSMAQGATSMEIALPIIFLEVVSG